MEKGSSAVGSGFFISPNHVLTSAHVLVGCRNFAVTNGRIGTMNARLEASEPRRDSAVLIVEGAASRHLVLGRAPAPRPGDGMTIVGFPVDRVGGRRPVTYAATFHGATLDEAGIPVLELDADIVAGASGAPVFDKERRLAGIVVGRLDRPPRDVVALSHTGLSDRMRRFFAQPPTGAPDLGTALQASSPEDAVVKIRCQ
ncbi:hypothetical protein ASG54_14505 [Aureimonas sp. Leaf460]|nr:hypothetical protein ASG62_01715 [Aureimonas sp. Leaf427]KQT75999.1 hypothetical protein ASG54_14505 [Aureimonas sp. Leaf460]